MKAKTAEPAEDELLTQDVDFLGSADDAELLCRLLGAELRRATLDDNTPNTAIAVMEAADGRKLLVDFLSTLIGLKQDEVRRMAVPIEVEGEPTLSRTGR